MVGRNWGRTGENAVNATFDVAAGVGKAFMGLGNKIKRGRFAKTMEAFCAVIGDVAAKNGSIKAEEKEAFKQFLLTNQGNPAVAAFSVDELLAKMEKYAIAAFTGDTQLIMLAIQGVDHGGDAAKMIMVGALALAFSDGDCDENETQCIIFHCNNLGITLQGLAQEFGIAVPELGAPAQTIVQAIPASTVQQVAAPAKVIPVAAPAPAVNANACPMCKGVDSASCNFCQGTGIS